MIEDILKESLQKIEERFYFAVMDTHEEVVDRIFEENKDVNGNEPKPYSTKPMWADRKSLPREAGTKSKSGKTRYFEGGYKELKQQIGRKPLELKGLLKLDFTNGIKQISPLEFQVEVNKESQDKIKGHFKTFFGLNEQEKKNLIKRING